MLQLYENIKALRIKKRMSQEELAIKTGYISRSSIAKIESGEVDLSQSKIVAFAEALGTTPMALMGWSTESVEDLDNKQVTDITLDEQIMIANYRSLSQQNKKTVDILMEHLSSTSEKNDKEI